MPYNLLKGKKGIIFGALNNQSIAWKVAERAFEEGATMVLTNAPAAKRLGDVETLARTCNAEVFYADATNLDDLKNLIQFTMQKLNGKIDFLLHSIGMSPNVRKGIPYENINYENYLKTLDVSALSLHKILQTCRTLDAFNEGASVVTLSYIASQRTFYGYNDMADAKAMLESIVRNFGYIYGREKKVRINAVSQSPTVTTAAGPIKGFSSLFDFSHRMAPLGNATAEECADYIITLFSDLTRKVTMQNLYHDGGFSSMGMSYEAMEQYSKTQGTEG